jgi:hypothetical protein
MTRFHSPRRGTRGSYHISGPWQVSLATISTNYALSGLVALQITEEYFWRGVVGGWVAERLAGRLVYKNAPLIYLLCLIVIVAICMIYYNVDIPCHKYGVFYHKIQCLIDLL